MATPKQFEIFENPIAQARRAFPFVVVLQSPLAETGRDRVVAPLAPKEALPPFAGRLMPVVEIGGREHAILVPSLTAIRTDDLRRLVTSVEREMDRITAAIDFLFFGI
jgi:toxin CcdB